MFVLRFGLSHANGPGRRPGGAAAPAGSLPDAPDAERDVVEAEVRLIEGRRDLVQASHAPSDAPRGRCAAREAQSRLSACEPRLRLSRRRSPL